MIQASGPAITWAYSYDWLDRLIRVDKDTVQQSVYVYDESDNRLELQLPGETHHYSFDFADRLLARSVNSTPTETFSHDADGNMIARTAGGVTTNYSWDSFDKLTSIQKPGFQQSFRYDSEGIRKSKGSDTRYFSSGATSLVDLLPTNSISYIQGHLILGMLQGGNYYWYIPDGLGTVRLVMDSSGTTVVSSFASDEFGRQTAVTGSPAHTFTGALGVRNEVGIDSQLLYARQRWYDPQLGRFLSQDPIGFAGGLNLYAYVGNNPANFVDPSGLDVVLPDNDQIRRQYLEVRRDPRIDAIFRQFDNNKDLDYYIISSLAPGAGTAREIQTQDPFTKQPCGKRIYTAIGHGATRTDAEAWFYLYLEALQADAVFNNRAIGGFGGETDTENNWLATQAAARNPDILMAAQQGRFPNSTAGNAIVQTANGQITTLDQFKVWLDKQ